jgi:hypothetical protein
VTLESGGCINQRDDIMRSTVRISTASWRSCTGFKLQRGGSLNNVSSRTLTRNRTQVLTASSVSNDHVCQQTGVLRDQQSHTPTTARLGPSGRSGVQNQRFPRKDSISRRHQCVTDIPHAHNYIACWSGISGCRHKLTNSTTQPCLCW